MSNERTVNVGNTAKNAIGFGTALAIAMSWTANQSVVWVCVHGLFGWLYVVYHLLTKDGWTWF